MTILLAVLAGSFILVTVSVIIGYAFGHWIIRPTNNPKKAWIFVRIGDSENYYRGDRIAQSSQQEIINFILTRKPKLAVDQVEKLVTCGGSMYEYGRNKELVVFPDDRENYPITYWKNYLRISVDYGKIIATPRFNAMGMLEQSTLVKHLTLSNIGAGMLKAMGDFKVGMGALIVIIAIVLIVAVGGVYVFNKMKTSQAKPVNTANTTQTTQQPQIERVK